MRSSVENTIVNADDKQAGGLVGTLNNATVENTYFTGTINAAKYVGGLVGKAENKARIVNSYAVAEVTATSFLGPLVGDCVDEAKVQNSYFPKGQKDNGFGRPLTPQDITTTISFERWDFQTLWQLNEIEGEWPKLR